MITMCPGCGRQLDGGDETCNGDPVRCPECGLKFKFNGLSPCPACGELIVPSLRICPKCKFRIAARPDLKAKTIPPSKRYLKKPFSARRASEEWAGGFGASGTGLIFSGQLSGLHHGVIGLMAVIAGVILLDCALKSVAFFRLAENGFFRAGAAISLALPAMIGFFIFRAMSVMLPSASERRKWNDFDLALWLFIPLFGFFAGMTLFELIFTIAFDSAVCAMLRYPMSYRLEPLEYRIAAGGETCPDCGGRLESRKYDVFFCPSCRWSMIRCAPAKEQSGLFRAAGEVLIAALFTLFLFFLIMGGDREGKLTVAATLLVVSAAGLLATPILLIFAILQKRAADGSGKYRFYRLPEGWAEEIGNYVSKVKLEWGAVVLVAATAFGMLILIRILPEFLKNW